MDYRLKLRKIKVKVLKLKILPNGNFKAGEIEILNWRRGGVYGGINNPLRFLKSSFHDGGSLFDSQGLFNYLKISINYNVKVYNFYLFFPSFG